VLAVKTSAMAKHVNSALKLYARTSKPHKGLFSCFFLPSVRFPVIAAPPECPTATRSRHIWCFLFCYSKQRDAAPAASLYFSSYLCIPLFPISHRLHHELLRRVTSACRPALLFLVLDT
jgi:hypothetical protein